MQKIALGALLLVVSSAPALAQATLLESVDLGQPEDGVFTSPNAINNRGDIVGSSWTAAEVERAFLWTASLGFEIILENGVAWDINNRGQVVGERYGTSGSGFLWTRAGGLIDLGPFIPYAINDAGTIAGVCVPEGIPCTWRDGVRTPLSTAQGAAWDVNARGDAVGQLGDHAYFWSRDGEATDLGAGWAESINNRGMIAGVRTDAGFAATLWTRDGVLSPTPSTGVGQAVNARGWLLVLRATEAPMVWNPRTGAIMVLRSTGGQPITYDMNERGDVAGTVDGPRSGHVMVWRVGARDLNARE
jgi:probable HAF family extracellular repeat protein